MKSILVIDKKDDIESVVSSLSDILEALRSDEPIDSFIKKWETYNKDVPNMNEKLREMYADHVELAVKVLESLL